MDVTIFNYQLSKDEFFIKYLLKQKDGVSERSQCVENDTAASELDHQDMEKIIVDALKEIPEIDYSSCADLLFKLAKQLVVHLQSCTGSSSDLVTVLEKHKHDMAQQIYMQMEEHAYNESPSNECIEKILPFVKIEQYQFSKNARDIVEQYTTTIKPTSLVPNKVFTGFKKSYHDKYKFDSATEQDFAKILEQDGEVLKWLRPAMKQFEMYWGKNSERYTPDFIVETKDAIYMVEIKMRKDMQLPETMEKAKVAQNYCTKVSQFALANGKKQWMYALIPHDEVKINMSFAYIVWKNLVK